MKVLKITTLSLMAIGLVVFLACTTSAVTEGDTGKGKLVFNDVTAHHASGLFSKN